MNKSNAILLLVLACSLFIFGCTGVETKTEFGLTIEDAILAKMDADDTLVPVDDAVFQMDEQVNMVLLNVEGFKAGTDGLHWFDIDVMVTGPNDEIILDEKGLLGEKGHIYLEDGIAKSPYGIFKPASDLEPGIYKMKVTIYDKISEHKASKTMPFELR